MNYVTHLEVEKGKAAKFPSQQLDITTSCSARVTRKYELLSAASLLCDPVLGARNFKMVFGAQMEAFD
jgi:hypothetical protein